MEGVLGVSGVQGSRTMSQHTLLWLSQKGESLAHHQELPIPGTAPYWSHCAELAKFISLLQISNTSYLCLQALNGSL